MVGDPAHLNQMAFLCSDDAANVFVQSRLKVIGDRRRSSFCGEDDVIGQLCECAHNPPCLLPPFHGGLFGMNRNPQAEAWGYALSSLRERIATKHNNRLALRAKPQQRARFASQNHNNVLAPRAKPQQRARSASQTTTTCSLCEPKPCDSPRIRRQRVATGINPWSAFTQNQGP